MRLTFLIFSLFYTTMNFAGEVDPTTKANITKGLKALFEDVVITGIEPTPVTGLYQVTDGSAVIYMYGDGRFVLTGDLLDAKLGRNISEEKRTKTRYQLLQQVSSEDVIEFSPKKRRHTIYVFTDVDCVYCRKLHQDMAELNRKGIAVRYLAFPRGGMKSPTAKTMQSIWCADDQKKAMTDAKNSLAPKQKTCEDPVAKQYELGIKMGVRGTPAVYSAAGHKLRGYMPPDELLAALLKGQ